MQFIRESPASRDRRSGAAPSQFQGIALRRAGRALIRNATITTIAPTAPFRSSPTPVRRGADLRRLLRPAGHGQRHPGGGPSCSSGSPRTGLTAGADAAHRRTRHLRPGGNPGGRPKLFVTAHDITPEIHTRCRPPSRNTRQRGQQDRNPRDATVETSPRYHRLSAGLQGRHDLPTAAATIRFR